MKPILIIEDNEKNLKLVRDVLQFKHYRTAEARTAAEGLRMAREISPLLVLLDIQLPDQDGIAVLHCLRSDSTTSAIPVVAITASAMVEDQEKILSSGFDGYITKPIGVRTFLETVRSLLGDPVED